MSQFLRGSEELEDSEHIYVTRNSYKTFSTLNYQCKHCNKMFSTRKAILEHLRNTADVNHVALVINE